MLRTLREWPSGPGTSTHPQQASRSDLLELASAAELGTGIFISCQVNNTGPPTCGEADSIASFVGGNGDQNGSTTYPRSHTLD